METAEEDHNLFEVRSDYDEESDEDDEFRPGGGVTKRDNTADSAALDNMMDNDEEKCVGTNLLCSSPLLDLTCAARRYKPVLDQSMDEEPPSSLTTTAVSSIRSAAPAAAKTPKKSGIVGLSKFIFMREAGGLMQQPSFRLVNEDSGQVVMLARKKQMRSPHVYIYAVSGEAGTPLKKLRESEKLEGVLMASSDLTEYRLVVDDKGFEEVAAASFDKTSIFTEMMHGFQPRRLSAIVPQLDDATHRPKKHNLVNGGSSLSMHLRAHDVDDNTSFHVLRTKEPVFQDGCYRLNFAGRASVPSVKNFQV